MPELTQDTKAALLERDNAKRAEMYTDLQKKVLETSPFVIIFQQTEVAGLRKAVQGLQARSDLRHQLRRPASRRTDRPTDRPLSDSAIDPAHTRRPAPLRWRWASHVFSFIVAITYLGLLAVTFFIGRVIPIDPVLAIVGDRAPASVVEQAREDWASTCRSTSSSSSM